MLEWVSLDSAFPDLELEFSRKEEGWWPGTSLVLLEDWMRIWDWIALPRKADTFLHRSRRPVGRWKGNKAGLGTAEPAVNHQTQTIWMALRLPSSDSSILGAPHVTGGWLCCLVLSPDYLLHAVPHIPAAWLCHHCAEPWLSASCCPHNWGSQFGQSQCNITKERAENYIEVFLYLKKKVVLNNKGPLREQNPKSTPGERSSVMTPKSFNTCKISQHSHYCFQEHIHNTIQMLPLKTFHNKRKLTLGSNTKKH